MSSQCNIVSSPSNFVGSPCDFVNSLLNIENFVKYSIGKTSCGGVAASYKLCYVHLYLSLGVTPWVKKAPRSVTMVKH
jgi:hypothetical protein